MHAGTRLVVVSVLFVLAFLPPAQAVSSPDNAMMREAENLNMSVPQMGNATLGTQESMTGMLDWLNACSHALVAFFNDTMKMLGISNTTYVSTMNKAFEPAMNNPPAISR